MDLRDGVAIRQRARCHECGCQGAVGARPVFQDDRLAEMFFGSARKGAQLRVDGTASRIRHDEVHRPRRIRLRHTAPTHATITAAATSAVPMPWPIVHMLWRTCPPARCIEMRSRTMIAARYRGRKGP